jgi:hypothetical protein
MPGTMARTAAIQRPAAAGCGNYRPFPGAWLGLGGPFRKSQSPRPHTLPTNGVRSSMSSGLKLSGIERFWAAAADQSGEPTSRCRGNWNWAEINPQRNPGPPEAFGIARAAVRIDTQAALIRSSFISSRWFSVKRCLSGLGSGLAACMALRALTAPNMP